MIAWGWVFGKEIHVKARRKKVLLYGNYFLMVMLVTQFYTITKIKQILHVIWINFNVCK